MDLDEPVPMMLDELDDIKRLVNLLEEWLRFEESACFLLTDWMLAVCRDPRANPSAADVIEALGTLSVKLRHILRAGIPDTGHTHHPTSP